MNSMYDKYAKLLVRYSLALKPGEKLLISSTYLAEPLIKAVYREALKSGAHPETQISLNELPKIFYDHASEAQLRFVSPSYEYAVRNYEAFLNIRAPFNLRELEGTDPEKKKIVAMAQATVKKLFMKRSFSGRLRWTLCEFPTDSQAQECGLSKTEYEEFVFSACLLYARNPEAEWNKIRASQQRVVDFLNRRSHIRIKADGTDISFSTQGRRWINSDGKHNMPSGEVFTAPVENSVNGTVRFSFPGIYMGQEIEGVLLRVERGEVKDFDATKGKSLLARLLEIPGARRFGEAAIGTNHGIQRFTKNTLFDEKMGGTIHLALGASYPEAGGKNQSPIHWDLITDMKESGEIFADGQLIYRKGRFTF